MKNRFILTLIVTVILCTVGTILCTLGCSSAERKVRIFDLNSGSVKEIRNVTNGFSREIAEESPDHVANTIATLQNVLCCDGARDRSIIRVYDTNARLQCLSSIPFPDGIYLCPRSFSVCYGRIIFWNSKFNTVHNYWDDTNELCVADLSNDSCIMNIKRIQMPTECGDIIDWEQAFMWSSPSSVVVNVNFSNATKRIAIVDTHSGDCRFLSLDIRKTVWLISSFQGSLSRRYFAAVRPNGDVVVCNGQGDIYCDISVERLGIFGLREPSQDDELEKRKEMLTICWDDGDVLWIFNTNGNYLGIDIETNSIIKNGIVALDNEDELIGIIQGQRAVIKHKREIITSILGNRFIVKDLKTGNPVAELPNFVSSYVYLGNGLLLLSDL